MAATVGDMQGITSVCQLLYARILVMDTQLYYVFTAVFSFFSLIPVYTQKMDSNVYLLNGLRDVNPLHNQVTDSHACALSD